MRSFLMYGQIICFAANIILILYVKTLSNKNEMAFLSWLYITILLLAFYGLFIGVGYFYKIKVYGIIGFVISLLLSLFVLIEGA